MLPMALYGDAHTCERWPPSQLGLLSLSGRASALELTLITVAFRETEDSETTCETPRRGKTPDRQGHLCVSHMWSISRQQPVAPMSREKGTPCAACNWHPWFMAGKEIDRTRARSALDVVKQHPAMVLFAISPVIVVAVIVGWLTTPVLGILLFIVATVAGGWALVRKR